MYLIKNLANNNLKFIKNAVKATHIKTTNQIMTGDSDLALITSFNDKSQVITIVDNHNSSYLSILYYKGIALQGLSANNIVASIKQAHLRTLIINEMIEVKQSA